MGYFDTSTTTANWTRTVGDNDGGVAANVAVNDGVTFDTGETAAGTKLEVDGIFSLPVGSIPDSVDIWANYTAASAHHIQVKVYNYDDDVYEEVGELDPDPEIERVRIELGPAYIKADGEARVKFVHSSDAGNATHALKLDKVAINTRKSIEDEIGARTPAESYAALGAVPTYDQFLFMILQLVSDRAITDVTQVTRKLDGATTAMTHTLDSSTNPTDVKRSG